MGSWVPASRSDGGCLCIVSCLGTLATGAWMPLACSCSPSQRLPYHEERSDRDTQDLEIEQPAAATRGGDHPAAAMARRSDSPPRVAQKRSAPAVWIGVNFDGPLSTARSFQSLSGAWGAAGVIGAGTLRQPRLNVAALSATASVNECLYLLRLAIKCGSNIVGQAINSLFSVEISYIEELKIYSML